MKIIRIVACVLFVTFAFLASAAVPQHTADSIGRALSSQEVCGPSCAYYAGEHGSMGLWNTLLTLLLVVSGAVWLYSSTKKKLVLWIGGLLSIALAASYFVPNYLLTPSVPANCPVVKTDPAKSNTFFPPSESEFESVDDPSSNSGVHSANTPENSGKNKSADPATQSDEFQSVDKSSNSDEFQSASASSGSDEFLAADAAASGDEFQSADSGNEFNQTTSVSSERTRNFSEYIRDPNIYEPLLIFLLTALISLFIKNATFRKYRGLFLLLSLIYLGFYRGACPCMISSFQNTFLIVLGVKVKWESLIFFLLLLPGAYFFGKIWCGWLCHLGALQEFLYKAFNLKILQGRKAQRILKITNISVLVLWIVQLILTRTNLFCEYDPFKVAYNLISPTSTGWILLGILLVSSVLMYRPFCRSFCPVGLILGWVSRIPGARHLVKESTCIDCKSCDKACEQRALIHEDKKTTLSVPDCILCGECISECKIKKSLIVK